MNVAVRITTRTSRSCSVPGDEYDIDVPNNAARPIEYALEDIADKLGISRDAVEQLVESINVTQ